MPVVSPRILLAAALIGAFAVGEALAHGGLSMDEDKCKLRVGPYVMHFVGYQPESPSGPKEFCEDIPDTGATVVVLDYVDDALRDLPTEVRIIRDTGSEQNLDPITVLHLGAALYPTGSLNFEINFSEPGKFIGLVSVGTGEKKMVSRFPFSVGMQRVWTRYAIPFFILIVGTFVLYRFGISRRNKVVSKSTA
jgi:hypothetical protein